MKKALICCIIIAICTSFKLDRSESSNLSISATIISRQGKSMTLGVKLTNNTSDSLKYVSWDCSWQNSYLIDNDKWRIMGGWDCFKNGQRIFSIPPYQSETKILELEKLYVISKSKTSEFRIGFHYNPPPPDFVIF